MELWITNFFTSHTVAAYLVILGWTFFEGETVVFVVSGLIAGGMIPMSLWSLAFSAFLGSAAGDMTWYVVGRHFGAPILARKPKIRKKLKGVMRLLNRYQTIFILTFRFIYGVRSVSPFVIGLSGISPLRFVPLNFISAAIWALSFTYGGYFLGRIISTYLNILLASLGVALSLALVVLWIDAVRRQLLGQDMPQFTRRRKKAEGEPHAAPFGSETEPQPYERDK